MHFKTRQSIVFEIRSFPPSHPANPLPKVPALPQDPPMRARALSSAVGLSAEYRALWAQGFTRADTRRMHEAPELAARLDEESRALLALATDLAGYIGDSPLSPYLTLDHLAALNLLPASTRRSLASFGYVDLDPAGEIVAIKACTDETLSQYGLQYLPDFARRCLANRDVVDAGSHDGTSARFFLENCPVQRVFCFEPDPANHVLLDRNTRAEQASGRLVASTVALSDRSGLARMRQAGVGSSCAKAELAYGPTVLVKAEPLDSVLRDHPDAQIGLIKLDVEGDAVPALQGAMRTIRTHRPILIVSFYHTPGEFTETPGFMAEHFPDYGLMVRKVAPHLFKEHVVIGVPSAA